MSLLEEPIAVVQEGTAWGLEHVFRDKADVLEVPADISYTISDEETDVPLKTGTIPPASTIEVALDKTRNTLQDRTKTEGVHVLTLTAEFASAEDALVIVTRWKIKRTKFL